MRISDTITITSLINRVSAREVGGTQISFMGTFLALANRYPSLVLLPLMEEFGYNIMIAVLLGGAVLYLPVIYFAIRKLSISPTTSWKLNYSPLLNN